MRALVWVALASAVAAAGCGLELGGLSISAAPADDGGHATVDGSPGDDGPIGPPIGEGAGDDGGVNEAAAKDGGLSKDGSAGACVAAIPQGWALVAYETARNACPAGYGAGHDEYTGATAGAGACTCTCQPTGAKCTSGTIATWWGNGGGACGNAGQSVTVAGSSCEPLGAGGTLAQYYASQAAPFAAGTCTGTPQSNPGQVTKQGVRYCGVPPTGADAVCAGMAPAGFAACIVSAGDVACPAGSPFLKKTLVADDETLACSACTTCTETGSCSNPKITLFADSSCTQKVVQLASDGSCVPTNANNQYVGAAEYSAEVQATCSASGSTPRFSPVGPHTLCCR